MILYRSSLDSIQQAVFASKISGKLPAIAFMILTMFGSYMNTELKKHVMNLVLSLFCYLMVKLKLNQ